MPYIYIMDIIFKQKSTCQQTQKSRYFKVLLNIH